MDEKKYSVSDLINDQSFRRLVRGGADPGEVEKWSQWMELSEENRSKAKKATSEIVGFEFSDSKASDFDGAWSKLYKSTIGKSDNQANIGTEYKDATLRWIYRAAAVILLAGTVALGLYYHYERDVHSAQLEQITQEETVTTRNGQQKTLTFTSGDKIAKIVLNGHSTLTYNIGLLHNEPIEVVLEGEAFFDVEKGFSDGHSAFSVKTPDGIIEDVGTEFLVTVENDLSRVVLQEGLVNIRSGESEDNQKLFQVRNGEMVEFTNKNIIRQETVNSTFYTSWATGSMQFAQTRISALAEYIEQRFNVNVMVTDPSLSDITLEGSVYFKSLEGLVRSVSDVTKIPVYQSANRDTVYIGSLNYTTN